MKKSTKVSWTTKDGNQGFGVTITDEEDGHIQVAVMSDGEKHHVIWCAVTWLTPLGS
jgi:hypothetical protein